MLRGKHRNSRDRRNIHESGYFPGLSATGRPAAMLHRPPSYPFSSLKPFPLSSLSGQATEGIPPPEWKPALIFVAVLRPLVIVNCPASITTKTRRDNNILSPTQQQQQPTSTITARLANQPRNSTNPNIILACTTATNPHARSQAAPTSLGFRKGAASCRRPSPVLPKHKDTRSGVTYVGGFDKRYPRHQLIWRDWSGAAGKHGRKPTMVVG
jgi:hypothetical protein